MAATTANEIKRVSPSATEKSFCTDIG